jgi:hypothetical protein
MCFSRDVTVHTLCAKEDCNTTLSSETTRTYSCKPSPDYPAIDVDPNNSPFPCRNFPLEDERPAEVDTKPTLASGGYICNACYAAGKLREMTEDEWTEYNRLLELDAKIAEDYLFSLPDR